MKKLYLLWLLLFLFLISLRMSSIYLNSFNRSFSTEFLRLKRETEWMQICFFFCYDSLFYSILISTLIGLMTLTFGDDLLSCLIPLNLLSIQFFLLQVCFFLIYCSESKALIYGWNSSCSGSFYKLIKWWFLLVWL